MPFQVFGAGPLRYPSKDHPRSNYLVLELCCYQSGTELILVGQSRRIARDRDRRRCRFIKLDPWCAELKRSEIGLMGFLRQPRWCVLVGTVLRGIGDGIVSGRRGSGFRGTCWLKRGSNFVSSGSNIQTMTSP